MKGPFGGVHSPSVEATFHCPRTLNLENTYLTMSRFQECSAVHGNETSLVLQCFAEGIEEQHSAQENRFYNYLLLLSGALVFFMQAGFAMLCAGSVRKKVCRVQLQIEKEMNDLYCVVSDSPRITSFCLLHSQNVLNSMLKVSPKMRRKCHALPPSITLMSISLSHATYVRISLMPVELPLPSTLSDMHSPLETLTIERARHSSARATFSSQVM